MFSTNKSLSVILCLFLGPLIAALVIIHPLVAVVCVALFFISALWSLYSLRLSMFLGYIFLGCLTGFAFLGKSFAYLGYPPIYIGEAFLFLGLLALLSNGRLKYAFRNSITRLAIPFVIWGAIRTFPNLGVYGIDALRDGVIWAYFLFALIVFAFLDHKDAISKVMVLYNRLIPWYLAWIPFAYLFGQFWSHLLPVLPISQVPLLTIKPGDVAVHLAGIGAFLFLHPVEVTPSRSPLRAWLFKWTRWAFWIGGFIVSGSLTRGGLLSILSAFVVVFVMRPLSGLGKMLILLMTASVVLLILDPKVDIGDRRIASPQQIVENFRSIARSPSFEMEATRQWRLDWWKDIVDYTLFGKYFWTGKGYGINLADSDGYQVVFYPPLRSPHNGHLNILARSGAPGLVTWVLLQFLFVWKLVGAYSLALRNNEPFWERTSLWILAYWTAFMVNSCFDVFLEGPQGGVWFWALFGFGIAAIECQRTKILPIVSATS